MRSTHILALATLAALIGAMSLILASPDSGPFGDASESDLVPDLTTSSTISNIQVLSESVGTIAPDTDLDGDPVEDHYDSTTTTAVQQAAEPAPEAESTTTTQASGETAPPPATLEEGHFDGGAEASFAGMINNLRSSNGLAGLSRSGSLDSEARGWAKTIGEQGSLSHSAIGRLVPPWSAVGENVGTGGSVSSVFNALAGSSGHLGNMLGDYTHFGLGAWVDAAGRIWTVHVFAR